MTYATREGDRFTYVGPDNTRKGKTGEIINERTRHASPLVKWDDGALCSIYIMSDSSLIRIDEPPKTRLQELMDQYKETRELHEKAKLRESSAKRERELLELKKQNLRNELLREIDTSTKPE